MDKCIISSCADLGTEEITDAQYNPVFYNGKKMCRLHFAERTYMKENDKFKEDIQCVVVDETL